MLSSALLPVSYFEEEVYGFQSQHVAVHGKIDTPSIVLFVCLVGVDSIPVEFVFVHILILPRLYPPLFSQS